MNPSNFLQSLSTHFVECVSESFGHKLSSEAFCLGMTILKFCNSFSAPALISDYKEPLETNIRHRVLLSIHFVVFLHSFPSHTVQILKESAAGSRSLELQPRSQVHPILLLQEYCPVHHRGKTHTEALSTESHAKSQMWMHSFEILFFKDANGTTTWRQRFPVRVSMFVFLLTGPSQYLPGCAAAGWRVWVLTYRSRICPREGSQTYTLYHTWYNQQEVCL